MKTPSTLAPFRHGAFTRYMCGEAVSMTGTWMQTVAQGWVLTGLTTSALALGTVNFAAGIPMLLLTLVGGSFADRYDKRVILHASLLTQMVMAAGVGLLVATDQIAIWHIFIAATVLGISASFEVPAVSAFVPELVAKDEISQAIAIDRSVFHATRLIGPALAGYLAGVYGVATAYFLNAASFLALMLAILTIGPRQRGTEAEEERRRGGIKEGLAFVRDDEKTRVMILLMCSITCFVSPFLMITLPLYARTTLGLGPREMGLLMGISGVGSFVGSLGLLSISKAVRGTVLKLAATSAVGALICLARAESFLMASIALVFLTLGLSTAFGLSNIVVQERAPDYIRGRVSSVAGMSFFGILPFSGMVISAVVDLAGMRTGLLGGALCYACASFVLLRRFSKLDAAAAPAAPAAQ